MLVPDDVWVKIAPKPNGGGLLCPTCIMDRASDICGWTVGFAYPERHGPSAGKSASGEQMEVVDAVSGFEPGEMLDEVDVANIERLIATLDAAQKALNDWVIACSAAERERDALMASVEAAEFHRDNAIRLFNDETERAKTAEALVTTLSEALEPFVDHLNEMKFDLDNNGNELPEDHAVGWVYVTNGDFRRARAALAALPAKPGEPTNEA